MMNLVVLVGYLGRDPESKETSGGLVITNLNLATSKKVKGEDRTEWHRVVCFGKVAEFAAKYLAKGRLVLVEGEMQTRSWEGKDGQKRYTTEVVANTLKALGPRPDAGDGGSYQDPEGKPDTSHPVPDDDVPF